MKIRIVFLVLLFSFSCISYGWDGHGVPQHSLKSPQRGQGLKIETPNPELSVVVKECVLTGNTAVIECLITNTSNNDVTIQFHTINEAYDEKGNVYNQIKIRIGSYKESAIVPFPAEIPVKCMVEIGGVDDYATLFKRINLKFYSQGLGVTAMASDKNPIKINNLKIDNRNILQD